MKNKTITFFEHERKTFGELKHCGMSKKDILKLIKLNRKLKIFKDGHKTIKAKQFVGALKINNTTIQILPKIYKNERNEEQKQKEALTNLLYMLSYTKKLKIKENFANLSKNNDLFEIYIYLFAKNLLKEIENGIYKNYNKKEENLTYLKGKLHTTKQIKHNYINKHKLYCKYAEFSENNLINKIFKYAVELLKNITNNPKNKKLLSDLSFVLSDIDYKTITINDFKKVKFNRMNERFKPYIEMAKMFILNESTNLNSKDLKTFSLIFNMDYLFEEFVGTILKKHYDEIFNNECVIHLQHSELYLLTDENNNNTFRLKPDIVVYSSNNTNKPFLIIDTKYKNLIDDKTKNYNINQSDAYQMFAYLKKYDCKKGVLLYPKYEKEFNKEYAFNEEEHLFIRTINLKHNGQNQKEYVENVNIDLKKIFTGL
ncbi:McrC family protein [Methanothermococcus sp. Ax23]|uniref:McrC family protein n=1 Tax=Methanothermococcus sp. Ax23 TaxID=3156486 RepID=UPI003BA38FE9